MQSPCHAAASGRGLSASPVRVCRLPRRTKALRASSDAVGRSPAAPLL